MTPSPATFDRHWPQLQRLADAPGRAGRWPQIQSLLAQSERDLTDLVTIAAAGLSQRIGFMTNSAPTEDKVWLVSGLLFNQLITPEGYTREQFYRLLWLILRDEVDTAITADDLFVLVDAVWAVKLTWDSEEPRRQIVSRWLSETASAPAESADDVAQSILPELSAALPPHWRYAHGTLSVVADQVLANLTVTAGTDEPATFDHVVELPAAALLRNRTRHWWRVTITATPESANIVIPDQNVAPDPSQLLRLSDFRAEADVYGLAGAPDWVVSYTDRRTIAYTPDGERRVVGTAEALDLVRCEAAFLGLGADFRTDDLVAIRLPVGYRVLMYQGPDIPFGDLILDSPIFYVGDDHLVYRPKAGNPLAANEQFRESFQRNNGYDSTTGASWPTTITPVLGPPRTHR